MMFNVPRTFKENRKAHFPMRQRITIMAQQRENVVFFLRAFYGDTVFAQGDVRTNTPLGELAGTRGDFFVVGVFRRLAKISCLSYNYILRVISQDRLGGWVSFGFICSA